MYMDNTYDDRSGRKWPLHTLRCFVNYSIGFTDVSKARRPGVALGDRKFARASSQRSHQRVSGLPNAHGKTLSGRICRATLDSWSGSQSRYPTGLLGKKSIAACEGRITNDRIKTPHSFRSKTSGNFPSPSEKRTTCRSSRHVVDQYPQREFVTTLMPRPNPLGELITVALPLLCTLG